MKCKRLQVSQLGSSGKAAYMWDRKRNFQVPLIADCQPMHQYNSILLTSSYNIIMIPKLAIMTPTGQPEIYKVKSQNVGKCTGIKRSSVVRMVKKNGYQQYKRLKTPRVTTATKQRRAERATALAEKFGKSKRSIERCVWQDEKDFTLEVPFNSQNSCVYSKGKKADVPDANLFHQKIGKEKK